MTNESCRVFFFSHYRVSEHSSAMQDPGAGGGSYRYLGTEAGRALPSTGQLTGPTPAAWRRKARGTPLLGTPRPLPAVP